MKRLRHWRDIAPRLLYESYPGAYLLNIAAPSPGMTIAQFAAEAEESGDTLFLFLCREADDDIDAAEYLKRLDRALEELESVRRAVAVMLSQGNSRSHTRAQRRA